MDLQLPQVDVIALLFMCLLVGGLVPRSIQLQGSQIAPCIWQNKNGSVINLNSIGYTNGTPRWKNKPTIDPTSDPNFYSVNPCHGFSQTENCTNVAACKITNLSNTTFDIGEVEEPNMYFSFEDNTVILEYSHTDGSVRKVSQIVTVCSQEEETQLTAYGSTGSTPAAVTYRFVLFSPCACYDGCPNATGPTVGTPPPPTISLHPIVTVSTSPPLTGTVTIIPIPPAGSNSITAGGVICILFVCSVCCYFLIGAAYMFFCAGARGKEIIPNVDFWMDLPNLIFEGLGFLLNCCRTDRSSPPLTSNGDQGTTEYDKI